MTHEPDLRELVGDGDLTHDEQARLRHVHELLLKAGPPPDLPETLVAPRGAPRSRVVVVSPRRLGAALALAGALAAAAFAVGFLVGDRSSGPEVWRGPIVMRGASDALASVRVGPADDGGNWPVLLRVSGLPPLPRGVFYELVLSKGSELGPTCGSFVVQAEGTTEVTMTVPFDLRTWSGWVIVRRARGAPASAPILTT
jgi:hypothetical protein